MGQSSGNSTIRKIGTWAAVGVLFLAVLVAARAPNDGGHWSAAHVMVVAALAGLALFVLVVLARQLAGVDHEASGIAASLATDPEQQRLLARWLQRARWSRWVGGFCGVLSWLLATNGRADVLLFGTAGIALGAGTSELHHLRRARGPRTARLEVRTIDDYLLPYDAGRMILVAAVAVAVGAATVWSSHTRPATWWALAAVAVLGLCRLAQWRVATRARPALSASLTRADDLVRELAIGRGLARPATFLAIALLARAGFASRPALGLFGGLFGIVAWCYAFTLWWHNRRLGLDFMVDEHRAPILT